MGFFIEGFPELWFFIKVLSLYAKHFVFVSGLFFGEWFASGLLFLLEGCQEGNMLSPLLFGIVKDFLSRALLCMVNTGKLSPMSINRSGSTPTHLLYMDDILLFCQCTSKNIENIVRFLSFYGLSFRSIC